MPDNKFKEFNTLNNEGSNFISSQEGTNIYKIYLGILLRWLEINKEIQSPS